MPHATAANAIPPPASTRRSRGGPAPPKVVAKDPTATKMASADGRQRSPTNTTTISSGERLVYVYPTRTSSGGSASARSHGSSGSSRSFTSDESWSEVEADDDGIEPSDSASRSRHPAGVSRRRTVEVRDPPSRHSSRRHSVIVEREREEPPPRRRQSSRREDPRRHESHSRHGRSTSRRVPSDDSSDNVASGDDYPYHGHHGMPRAGYYRQQPPSQSHGGYPPSMTSGSAFHDPYGAPHQALMRIQHQDPFGYPPQNPFSPTSQQPNPFSPMSREDNASYFAEPMGPPPQPQHRQPRPDAPPRPQSFAAPHSHFAGSELMAPYQQPPMPGFGHWPAGYPPYPIPGWPHSAGSSPQPKEEKEKESEIEKIKELLKQRDAADEAKKKDEKMAEIESLKDLIKKHEEEAVARQKAWIAEREAEAAAKAAEKAKAEEEKKRKQEIDDARKKAKEDAEKKAEDAAKKFKEETEAAAKKAKDDAEAAAKKAKDEHEKKLAEAEKAKEEADKAKKALEEEVAKNKPEPDTLKPPIKFKDAVGRKFSFPWHLCKTWKGMETLIKQAFLHVDVIGDHVHQGHYDLTGPDGEIILPQVWDSMVKPDYEITMHLWPMEEDKPKEPEPMERDPFAGLGLGGGGGGPRGHDPFAGLGAFGDLGLDPMHMGAGPKPKSGKKKGEASGGGKKKKSPDMGHAHPMGIPPPPPGAHFPDPFAGFPAGISPVLEPKPAKSGGKGKARSKSKSSKEISPLAAWFAGGSLNAKPARKR